MEAAEPLDLPKPGTIVLDPDSARYKAVFGKVRRLCVDRVYTNPVGVVVVVLKNPELARGVDRSVPLPEFLARYQPAA